MHANVSLDENDGFRLRCLASQHNDSISKLTSSSDASGVAGCSWPCAGSWFCGAGDFVGVFKDSSIDAAFCGGPESD